MGRSQRHLVDEQGAASNGECSAPGVIADGLLLQAADDSEPVVFGAELQSIDDITVPHGAPGGPLSGSSLTGAIPESLGGGTDPEPEPAELIITSPEEGETVPPIHDIIGTGADPLVQVELMHEGTVVALVAPAQDGSWGFTGDTPASLGDVTWVVRNGTKTASVNITVAEEDPPASRSKKKGK